MKLATTLGDWKGYVSTPAEAVRAYENTGFRHLDYDFYSTIYPGSPFLSDSWKDQVLEAKRTADSLGFDFVQAHSPNYNPLNPQVDHEAGMLATLRSLEACAMLGIPNIVVHTGYTPAIRYADGKDAYFTENRRFLEKLIPTMEKTGVNVLIENSAEGNMGDCYFFMTGQDMVDFIRYVNHPLLHACWDIGHANMRGVNQYDDIKTLGKDLYAVHIQDNMGREDEHIAPFMGTVNMDAVMCAMREIGYRGAFTFEANNILQRAGGWPHRRNEAPAGCENRLSNPNFAVRKKATELLYEIGKYILESYDCFEN